MHWRKPGSFVLVQDVYTAGFFEAHSLWIPSFMGTDKLHWFPIHSLMLMFDQVHCRPIFSVVPAHSWPGVKNILSWLLSQFMSGKALHFVGNFYLIVFANTDHIKYMPFCDFQYKYITFLYTNAKYVFEPNRAWHKPWIMGFHGFLM